MAKQKNYTWSPMHGIQRRRFNQLTLSDQDAYDQAVESLIEAGAHVESQSSDVTVLVLGRRANHVLHLLLSLVTCGVWLPVWFMLSRFGGETRYRVVLREPRTS